MYSVFAKLKEENVHNVCNLKTNIVSEADVSSDVSFKVFFFFF